ncbi:MAG: hypothetical protein IJY13_01100 [Clostridia bacterium]|nr:hypothetical protein [Clostridia bacterium]
MIFPTRKKITKGKSVTAVCDFSATQPTQGKIAMATASNVKFSHGLTYGGAFTAKNDGVLQYLATINGEQVALKSSGLTMGIRTFGQFAGMDNLVWTFDDNTNTLAVVGKTCTYRFYSGNSKKISDLLFTSLAFCQSRLFGLLDNRLYVSEPTETTFQNDVWIDLPTSCCALVNNGELYAIGNDVYKINLDGEDDHIKITKICSNVGVVKGSTVCAYGNKIMFVANDKIMCLQHGSLRQIADLQATPTFATMHNGLYYVSANLDGIDTLIGYNPHNGKMSKIHHVSAKNAYSSGETLLVSDGASGFELVSNVQPSYWQSLPINFDNQPTTKHLHRLLVNTATDVDVTIHADTSRTYHVKGKEELQSILLVGHGKHITLDVSSTGVLAVKHLSLTVRPSEVSV